MRAVADFYDRHPYPLPHEYIRTVDPDFWAPHPYQSVGHWDRKVTSETHIWVLGCGVNQAIDVALRWPMAKVYATDASPKTIELVRSAVERMEIRNLRADVEDFDEYDVYGDGEPYDLIICTGVAHHFQRSDWLLTLRAYLKPDGLLELLVYNEEHRREGHRFQQALRAYFGELPPVEVAEQMLDSNMLRATGAFKELRALIETTPEAERADMLIHPHERLYTFESLLAECRSAYMTLLHPVIPEHWEESFRAQTEHLGDHRLWTWVDYTRAPLLWFYLQREDSPRERLDAAMVKSVWSGPHARAVTTGLEKWTGSSWAPHGSFTRTWVQR